MSLKKYFYILFGVLFCALHLYGAGQISIESHVDKSTIYIGDVIKYSVVVTHDKDIDLQTPTLAINLGQFEIRDYKVLESREQEDGQIVDQTDYLISTFDTGEFEIPELEIGYSTTSDSTIKFLKTEPITIKVESLVAEEAGDIRDIKPPVEPPQDIKFYIIMGIIALVVLIAAALGFYFWKRRRAGKSILPKRQEPPRPAHQVALEQLEKLVNSDLLQTGKIKEYFIQLSDIVRHYIEGRFFISAIEMTTTQLLENMKTEQLDKEYIEMMYTFLNECDLVKFAKYIPEQNEIDKTTQDAFDFINATKVEYEKPEAVQSTAETENDPVDQEETTVPETEEQIKQEGN